MKNYFLIAVAIAFTVLCLPPMANATLMGLGNDLIYDSDLNAVWYGAPHHLESTYEDASLVFSQINSLRSTAVIGGQQFLLDWGFATGDEVETLDWTDRSARDLFTPYYHNTNNEKPIPSAVDGPWEVYKIRGRVADFADPRHPEIGSPEIPQHLFYEYDVWKAPGYPAGLDPRDFYNWSPRPDTMMLENWAIATITPVPEPSTVFLLGSGLFGLAWYRQKRKKT